MREIHLKGFTTNIEADNKLAIALFGDAGSGKTHFACTAPDPIGFIPLDRKTRKTVLKSARELGKTILVPEEDFIRNHPAMELAAMKVDAAMTYYRAHVDKVKEAAFRLYDCKEVKTIVIDTGSQLWEDMLFAHFGRAQRIMPRDRGAVNQEMIDLLNCLSGKNLILTHKSREIWRNDKPTGRCEHYGFPHLAYHVNVIAECVVDESKRPEEAARFVLNCTMCQDNPEIQGPGGRQLLADDAITFPYLAISIFPDDEVERWT